MATKKESTTKKTKAEPKVDHQAEAKEALERIKQNVILSESFFDKFTSGTKSAATKARNALMDIIKDCKVVREKVMEIKKEQ